MSNNRFSIKKRLLLISALSFSLALVACSNNAKESSSSEKKEESSQTPASVSSEPAEVSSSVPSSVESSVSSSEEITSSEVSEETTSSIPEEETFNIVRPEFTPDYDNYTIGMLPSAVNMTYYTDVYSRGFSWLTSAIDDEGQADDSSEDTDLYLVKSDKGEQADFSNATYYPGTTVEVEFNADGNVSAKDGSITKKKGSSNDVTLKLYSHKVHVENLEKGQAYSYKIGSDAGYAYGAFIVEKENAETITAVHMSDAQTKDLTKTNVWRNTFGKAVDTAGKDLDFALYNGDQFDQNNATGNNKKPSRVLRYTKALDVIQDYKFDIPYMASSGNHEPSVPYINYLTGDIDYAAYGDSGCYYSYDYQFAHFAVLNTNDMSDDQINWLKADLEAAKDAKWKVVMLHISPYSTGDHTNKSDNQKIVEKLTPVFSEKHVDLVLQAHDHTYNKTLPYKWDAAGYTQTYDNDEVVNFDCETETIGEITYDKNPEGTYYVTTGAAGHRCGAPEAEDGIWAEVIKDGEEWKGVDSSKTFLNNKYKIEMGTLKYANKLESYTVGSYTIAQDYKVGDLATGCVNAQMFGVLNLSETTLSYNVYTVKGESVDLFDSVDVLKA